MQNKKLLKSLSYLAFICSAAVTIMLMLTLAETTLEKVLSTGMAIVMQASCFIFMKLWLDEKKGIRIFYGLLAIILFASSIFATLCYQFNQNNVAKNEELINSEGFRLAKQNEAITNDNRNVNKDLLSLKKKEIEDLKINFENEIASIKASSELKIKSLTQSKNNLPRDYITQKQVIQNKINKVISDTQDRIQASNEKLRNTMGAKSAELSGIVGKIESQIPTQTNTQDINIQKQYTKGYLAFAAAISDWNMHGEELIILIIQIILSIIFEVTAVGLYLASQDTMGAKVTQELTQPKNPIQSEVKSITNNIIPIKKEPIHKKYQIKNKIGFRQEVTKCEGLKDEDVTAYMNAMYETSDNNKCKGYKSISKVAGIKEGTGRRIYNSLQTNGAIKVIDGVTTIMKDREDIKL